MRILIIEDEERSFTRLKRLLQNIDATFDVCGPITNVAETVDALKKATNGDAYDIIFADIRLDDGDVFDAFVQTPPQCPVIFTTAYNEYALEAFRSNGIAYLQKPIVPQELSEAVNKAKKLIANNSVPQDFSALFDSLGLNRQNYREHFLIQNHDGYTILNVQDISHIATENGVARAFLHNGRSMALEYSLNDIERQLDPSRFFRANRQYIISIDAIDRLHFHFNYKLSVKLKAYPDVSIIASKEKSAQLKEWIDR